MLKWAVGQRVPSSASSTCSDITPSVACCSSTFRQNTFKLHSAGRSAVRTAYVRNLKTADKENRKCRRSLEKEMKTVSGSSRSRDSIYMHLDNLPAALRDVSNHWSPGCENIPERDRNVIKKRNVRLKKSPCRVNSHKSSALQPLNSTNENKKQVCESQDECHVTTKEAKDPIIGVLGKKKQPCSNNHDVDTLPTSTSDSPVDRLPDCERNKTSMLVDNGLYFTIQTSPPDEPDELFHKELPIPNNLKKPNFKLIDDCDNNLNFKENHLPKTNEACICDIDGNRCAVSSLTKSLSWLRLNTRTAKDLAKLNLLHFEPEDDNERFDSSLEISNPNSAVLSENSFSIASASPAATISKASLKRKFTSSRDTNLEDHRECEIAANEDDYDVAEKIKSKRRCVIFNEQSFPLNTPPCSEKSHISSGVTSIDLDKPSTLKRQKVIRRKNTNRKRDFVTVPQTIYNKNLKSWLTLPNGIPSPFEVNEKQFKILSCTPMTTQNISPSICDDTLEFSLMKKAVSTPKPNFVLELTEDVFLSPGIRPLLDSVLTNTSLENNHTDSKNETDDTNDTTCALLTVSEQQTWNSHHILPDADPLSSTDNDINCSTSSMRSSNSSKINDDQDVFSSIVSSTPTLASSPTSTSERHPRSRRCLSFISPPNSKSSAKQNRCETGQLDLRIYFNNGLLTVHIIRARNLVRSSGELPCNAYVKVNLVPQGCVKTFHRTCVRKNSCNPKFDHKFSMEIMENDLNKRVLISAWHRDRGKQKSEFLGCMSFAVKNVLRKEINGSYKLLSQKSNKSYVSQFQAQVDVMSSQTVSYSLEKTSNAEIDKYSGNDKLKSMTVTKKDMNKVHEEFLFLQHLELDPAPSNKDSSDPKKSGRTPFTTTHKLTRQSSKSYGFSIAWTHPPRIERVEADLPADLAGLKPGDNVIFVNKINVVTLPEEKILDIIKNCGNQLVLEIYRKPPVANGSINFASQPIIHQLPPKKQSSFKVRVSENSSNNKIESRSTTAYSTATAASTETSKRRLQLPQITFSSEEKVDPAENSRQFYVFQLLKKEQQYALSLQFGISRFLLPLAERRDVMRPNEHQVLFQNVQELLRITEDILERTSQDEGEGYGKCIGKLYMKKFPAINAAYRKYCCGLKKADCILVEKTRCSEFMRLVTDPPIPKKRPDLVSFIHKPLQHYRDILKSLQLIANCKESKEIDHHILTKLISELQATYRDITVESGLMDCSTEGRPILSLQDLESRLVFTRCKPFTLNMQGRKWIFGGDLSRVEGKSTRSFWTLLFSDILLFTKINRDRVVFVTEEPLPLSTVNETQFNIKKRDTEFRLIIGPNVRGNINLASGNNSPAQQGCVPMVHFHSPLARRSPQNKDVRRRTLVFRAPSPELKAVWQNLIQRQIIKINTTGQGITPASSPMESPNQYTTAESLGTMDTNSTIYKRQCDGPINDFIENKCKQIGKSTEKGRAYHLVQWMKGEFDKDCNNSQTWSEPDIEIWSEEMLKEKTEKLDINLNYEDNVSAVTEIDLVCEESRHVNEESNCTNDKVSLCQKCHETCLPLSPKNGREEKPAMKIDAFLDSQNKWENLPIPTLLSPTEPFNPIPNIAITPPDTPHAQFLHVTSYRFCLANENKENADNNNHTKSEDEDDDDSNSEDTLPYKSLQSRSTSSLKRFVSFTNLNAMADEDDSDKDVEGNNTDVNANDTTNDNVDNTTENPPAMSWANRATTFVAQKIAAFERIGENMNSSVFLESLKYLRPSRDYELTSTSQTLAFEEDCENSGGTSGDEFWGTPNSGGASVASNEGAALSPSSSHDDEDDDSEKQIMEEMLLNRTTAMLAQQHNMTPSRMMSNKARLETLPEDEEENMTKSSSMSTISSQATSVTASECTMSCPVTTQHDEKSNTLNNSYSSHIGQSSSVFSEFTMKGSQSMEESNNNEVETKIQVKNTHIKKSKLVRFFSRVAPNEEDKNENKFWRKLRRRQTN
ncbi:uncharacterized protein PsGEF isoform X2 [Planococcus citri]|uniref:uncharacterized protein PsGEF isoform X2 n=1 Tax=Planococcus citri TaxID=170843 RepID=UPI0031F90D79